MYLKAFNLEDCIDYEDEVKSKTIIEDGERKILLISLKEKQELEKHSSTTDAAIYVLKGEILFIHNDNRYEIKKDEMFLIPKDEEHSVIAKKNSKFMVVRL